MTTTSFKEVMDDLESIERRAQEAYESRRDELADIFERMDRQLDNSLDEGLKLDLENEASIEWHNYGLSFDYVEPFTFDDQRDGYYRFQISWGGPSEELRAWYDSEDNLRALEFWFLDWGEGAMVDVIDCSTMRQAMQWNYDLMK